MIFQKGQMAHKSGKTSSKVDMLGGNLVANIIMFALPLIASGILQQSFNSVDVAVVGRWVGREALAAVGSPGPIVTLIVNLFVGISVGANVVIATLIGQKNEDGIRKAVQTSWVLSIICGVAIMCIGLAACKPLLRMVSTPDDVIGLAGEYLSIFFLGMPFMMIYNFGSAIMRSTGDTRRPFYALVIGGIVNVALNLLLVIVFDMGVAGVGIATVVANMVNAGIITYWLTHEEGPYRVNIRSFRLSRSQMKRIFQIGMPAGLQGVVFSFSNVFVLGGVNSFGSAAAAGSSVALTYEVYCYFIMVGFVQATMAFTSQNYGAGQLERCKRIFRMCMLMSILCCGTVNGIIAWQHNFFSEIFTSDPEAMEFAAKRLTIVLSLQWMASTYEISGAAMRGYGYSMTPTLLTILGTCIIRVPWVIAVVKFGHSFNSLMWVYPFTWLISGSFVIAAYFIVVNKINKRCLASTMSSS